MTARILAFSGSCRRDSFNTKLLANGVRGAESAGATVTTINLADYPLPLFNQDLEAEGAPEHLAALKAHFFANDGLLLACPEYNSSITPLLKNTIDWVSRAAEGEQPLAAYKNKACVLLSASPGALGGLRGLVHVRSILGSIGVIVLPDQVAVGRAFEAFDDGGVLIDEKMRGLVTGAGTGLANFLHKHTS